jgi:hypothetical protein
MSHSPLVCRVPSRFARKDLKLKPPNLEELEDTMNVYKRGFWAWFMSGRPKQESRWLERSVPHLTMDSIKLCKPS